VSVFSSSAEVYRYVGQTMQDVVDAPGFAVRLRQLDLVLRYEISRPAATVTAAFPREGERRLELGASSMEPTVTVTFDGESAHQLFLGDLNVYLARDQGRLAITGEQTAIGRFFAVLPQMRLIVGPLYRAKFYGYPGAGRNDWARGGPGGEPIVVKEGLLGG
jgi:hypothetical protein